mgnify:CR=1 FL=1
MSSHVVVLAAGHGTRMRTSRPKVLHRLGGLCLIEHVLRAASSLSPASVVAVVGHQADRVKAGLGEHAALKFALQSEQRGTGHALMQAAPHLTGKHGTLVVLSGDVPLVRAETLQRLVTTHEAARAAMTVITAQVDRPHGYGRIVRVEGALARVVEERDASDEQRRINEINSGIYAFDLEPLFVALEAIPAAGSVNEVYLPSLVTLYRRQGRSVETISVDDPNEVRGINSQTELAEVKRIVRQSKNEELMAEGVTIEDPTTTYIDADVTVGADTVLHPGVILEGRTSIGARCELHAGVRIVDSTLGDDVLVRNHCVIERATVGNESRIGPFAHLRPDTEVGRKARIGNFVETKKTRLGDGSKAGHLTYLGDATIGAGVNVGAGTITCNYDGRHKHPTTIGDRVFIGSGTELVAPVTLGDDAYVGAGSTITEDVPTGALGVARGRQVNKEDWATSRKSGARTDD